MEIQPEANPKHESKKSTVIKKWIEPLLFTAVLAGLFTAFSIPMGMANAFGTMMETAYDLLVNTVLYIMAIAVLMGAISALLSEFGVIDLLNRILSPLMKPIYGLPGAAALGIVTTYLSDNPAILSLANDRGFRKYFKKYQLYPMTNLGTAFGMGLIVSTFMLGLSTQMGTNLGGAVIIGNVGAIIGSIISTRLMLWQTKRMFGKDAECDQLEPETAVERNNTANDTKANIGMRTMNALMQGGKTGVDIGLSIIPGVLIICTLVIMLTKGPSATGEYTGSANEGIAVIPWIADKLEFILKPLFGFTSGESVAVPVTALGSAGAAIGVVPQMISDGVVTPHDISVFTAMCMCWSGYLSTHVSMMNALGRVDLSGRAIVFHTIGGLCAGVAANWLFKLFELIL